jgi:hypothetical protein
VVFVLVLVSGSGRDGMGWDGVDKRWTPHSIDLHSVRTSYNKYTSNVTPRSAHVRFTASKRRPRCARVDAGAHRCFPQPFRGIVAGGA